MVEEIAFEATAIDDASDGETLLRVQLGEYLPFVEALLCGDLTECEKIASQMGKLIDSVADAINEIAVEVIGDMLIEEGDGGFTVIEDYREMI